MILRRRPVWLGAAGILAVLGSLWLVRWPLALGFAALTSEHRPELMTEASQDPAMAAAFNASFRPGTDEAGLVAWLGENRFSVDTGRGRAVKRLESIPCNETLLVEWRRDSRGKLTSAKATVPSMTCL